MKKFKHTTHSVRRVRQRGLQLKYASRATSILRHLKIEAYNLTMSPNNGFQSIEYNPIL